MCLFKLDDQVRFELGVDKMVATNFQEGFIYRLGFESAIVELEDGSRVEVPYNQLIRQY